MNLDKEIDLYIKLRDWLEAEADKFKGRTQRARDEMAKIEGQISAFLKETGQKNGATPSGGFYISHKHSVTITDKTEFGRFVMGTGNLDLIDLKANANAVFEFAKENDSHFPPGLNPTTVEKIHVTRPK